MLKLLRNLTAYVVCSTLLLSGCVTATGSRAGIEIGPELSSLIGLEEEDVTVDPDKPRLDIIIPVFDPGLPEDGAESADTGTVWPELRRAEANRFAYKLKLALEETGAFGAVRVTPDEVKATPEKTKITATGDLYLLGTIEESNGEDVEISIEAFDVSGERWFGKSFDHSVDENYHSNLRNKGKDPYDPVFDEAAKYVLKQLQYYDNQELEQIKQIADLRFASSFSDDAFADYLDLSNDQYSLNGYPDSSDPMLIRTQAVRVRDQLFVDGLQQNYSLFSEKMETSYLIWQEQSQLELQYKREAQRKAAVQAGGGVLLITLAIAGIVAGAQDDNPYTGSATTVAGEAAGLGGALLLAKSWRTSEEAQFHVDAIEELGKSIDMELAPQVIAFEEKTVKLKGTASKQFAQWRAFLKQIYEQESVPDVQL